MKRIYKVHNQRGAVLLIALVFLAMTAMISSTLLTTSVLEAKMVGNSQFKEEAFQVTEGVLDAIVENYNRNLPVTGAVGNTICAAGDTSEGCNLSVISLSSNVTTVSTGVTLDYSAQRLGPLLAPLPIRLDDSRASSSDAFSVAIFELNAEYDGRDSRLSHHEVFEGVAVRVANAGQ